MTAGKSSTSAPTSRPMLRFVGDLAVSLAAVLPLLAGWWLLAGLGAFPVNDDFLYARSVQILVDEGRFEKTALNGLPTVSAATQIVWGALWCRLLGRFSFQNLQASTLGLMSLGAMAAYAVARTAGCRRRTAWLLSTTLVVSPYYFGHAFTFMTDGPAVAVGLISLLGYLRGLRAPAKPSIAWLVFGSVACSLGVLLRETCAAVMLVPILALLLQPMHRVWRAGTVRTAAAALLLPSAGLVVVLLGGLETGNVRGDFPGLARRFDVAWCKRVGIDAYGAGLFVGLVFLPAAPLLVGPVFDTCRRYGIRAAAGASVAVAMGAAFATTGGRTFLTNATGPFLQNAHFGPIVLSDAYDAGRLGEMGNVVWPAAIWQVATVLAILNVALIGILGAGTLIRWLRSLSEGSPDSVLLALLATVVASALALLVMFEVRFDRYWMALIPPLVAWLAGAIAEYDAGAAERSASHRNPSQAKPGLRLGPVRWLSAAVLAGCVLAAPIAWLSLAFTHDLLAFHAACWRLVDQWQLQGFRPEQIDGGYAINGWFRSAEDPATMPRPNDRTRWWASRAERFLAVGPREGFAVIAECPWHSWATGRTHVVYGLERAPPIADRPIGNLKSEVSEIPEISNLRSQISQISNLKFEI